MEYFLLFIMIPMGLIALWRIIYCISMSMKYNIYYRDGDPKYSHLRLFNKE